MSRIKLPLDEDCQTHALASVLRQHGLDIITTNEAGTRGTTDIWQLSAAFAGGRVLVTNNIRDFVPLHRGWLNEGRAHRGIIVFPQQEFSISETVRRLARLIGSLSAEQMHNRLEWLNSWKTDKV